jgi:hypothetical protein
LTAVAITDTDLIALASLSETDTRLVRDMPKGIGAAALHRIVQLKLAKLGGSQIGDYYTRTTAGTGVLRNNSGRLEQLRMMGKLDIVQLAEIAAITDAATSA